MASWIATVGALSGASSVVLGALGAHGLKSQMTPQQHATFMTANKYHMLHSVLVFSAASLSPLTLATKIGCYAILGGIVLFSFAIYALNLLPSTSKIHKLLGPVPPFGGTSFIIGWLALAYSRSPYSKYTTVAARATRQALKETERAEAERRAYQALRYQEWKNGEAGEHINLGTEEK
ncbi:hypothetical protein MNAN1_000685 [Malassezia nana]|uniref:DUF423-domain-containing protein n=1 Tax=Malassezia nana TaxID=180528 RepID=A0AAF0J1A2_9BASI|nr:hypothetical protein MNAN1_000685 [Malassezia nana]